MIELINVRKEHRRGNHLVTALRGISGSIDSGAITFIVGPSGSGKSTLLQLIGALDAPSGGEIIVQGRKLSELTTPARDHYRRHEVGFVFQNFNLLSNLNVLENVLVPFLPAGTARSKQDEAKQLLQRVGLGDRLEHRPSQLSGGEQQRVALVRALLKRPLLVLADEPTGELDSQSGAEVYRYLRELRDQEHSTVIVVTHDRSHITADDRLLTIRDGMLVSNADSPAAV